MYLTLTNVVFESELAPKSTELKQNLTLTNVVFELRYFKHWLNSTRI